MNVDRILRMASALGFSGSEVCVSRADCGRAEHAWYAAVRSSGQPVLAAENGPTVEAAVLAVEATVERMVRTREREAIDKARVFTEALESPSRGTPGGSDAG